MRALCLPYSAPFRHLARPRLEGVDVRDQHDSRIFQQAQDFETGTIRPENRFISASVRRYGLTIAVSPATARNLIDEIPEGRKGQTLTRRKVISRDIARDLWRCSERNSAP